MRNKVLLFKLTLMPFLVVIFFGFSDLGTTRIAVGAIPESGTGMADDEVPYGVASSWLLGRQLLVEGQTDDALPYLHFAYRAQPGVQAIAMTFQEALADGGFIRDALEVMDSLVAAWPDSQSYLLRRSSLNLQAGHRDKALTDLREIRRRGIGSPEVISAEATLLAAAGRLKEAVAVYRDGLELFPAEQTQFYLGMASIHQQEGKLDLVPSLIDEALVDNGDSAGLWLVKIRSLAALERHEEAVSCVGKATEKFQEFLGAEADSTAFGILTASGDRIPDSPEFFFIELADFYAQHGELTRAVNLLQPLSESQELGLSPSLWLGRLYLGTGRDEDGAALVDGILEQWPDSPRAWFLRGKVAENSNDWLAAVPFYLLAAGLDTHDSEIRLGLVRSLLVASEQRGGFVPGTTQGDSNRAELRQHAMVASMITPDDAWEGQLILGYAFLALEEFDRGAYRFELAAEGPEFKTASMTQMSICLDRLGKTAQARGALETLRREDPEDPEIANSLGYFLAEKGIDLELAESLILEALEAQPGNGAFLDSLGWVYYRLGRFEDALDHLIRAINVLPEDPVILEHVGVTLLELDQPQEAYDLIKRALDLGGDQERLESLLTRIGADLADEDQGR
ncbi:MAG: tetratricopeptide repeat protein [Gemmatimonadales bacterium]|nr:tetratricopeptide repeat protein [Gemmatimonadales bacterium]